MVLPLFCLLQEYGMLGVGETEGILRGVFQNFNPL